MKSKASSAKRKRIQQGRGQRISDHLPGVVNIIWCRKVFLTYATFLHDLSACKCVRMCAVLTPPLWWKEEKFQAPLKARDIFLLFSG